MKSKIQSHRFDMKNDRHPEIRFYTFSVLFVLFSFARVEKMVWRELNP